MFENTLIKILSEILNTSFFEKYNIIDRCQNDSDNIICDLYDIYIEGQFITEVDSQMIRNILSILKYIENKISDDMIEFINLKISSDINLPILLSKNICSIIVLLYITNIKCYNINDHLNIYKNRLVELQDEIHERWPIVNV